MNELKIVATITIKEGFRDELMTIFKNVIDSTRKEPGNISYVLHQDVKDNNKYIIFEEWKSLDAIDLHNESSHFKAFVQAIEGKIEGLDITVMKEV